MKYANYLVYALFAAAVFAAGCVQPAQPSAFLDSPPAGAKIVEITAAGFSPATLSINAGETVAFVNKDTANHWVASAAHPTHAVYPESGGCIGSKFDACAPIPAGKVFIFAFDQKGEWKYHDHLNCCINPAFFGTVIVK